MRDTTQTVTGTTAVLSVTGRLVPVVPDGNIDPLFGVTPTWRDEPTPDYDALVAELGDPSRAALDARVTHATPEVKAEVTRPADDTGALTGIIVTAAESAAAKPDGKSS